MRYKQFGLIFGLVFIGLMSSLHAQPCDLSSTPDGLSSVILPSGDVQLSWNAVPGSAGILLQADAPDGTAFSRRLGGPSVDQYVVPASGLMPGIYAWRIRAACSAIFPFAYSPASLPDSFSVTSAPVCPANVLDMDGNFYPVVSIGTQCWMAKNLVVTRYPNGDSIPGGLANADWKNTDDGARATYDEDSSISAKAGYLYNWLAVDDSRGLCPLGWHVPTDAEWSAMSASLGGELVAGAALKSLGTSDNGTGLWRAPNVGASNSSGFSGVPGGIRTATAVKYQGLGFQGVYWTATSFSTTQSWIRMLWYANTTDNRQTGVKGSGYSVRCMKD